MIPRPTIDPKQCQGRLKNGLNSAACDGGSKKGRPGWSGLLSSVLCAYCEASAATNRSARGDPKPVVRSYPGVAKYGGAGSNHWLLFSVNTVPSGPTKVCGTMSRKKLVALPSNDES